MAQNNGDSLMYPMDAWLKWRDMMLESWSKTMSDFVATDAYAQTTGTLLGNYLTLTTPAQEAVERAMEPVLTQLNMPSKSEITSLARRMTNIELRLDDLDAKLDDIQSSLEKLEQPKSTRAKAG
jgi:peptidoglycan hydrolase CwlO-like protein